MENVKTVHLYVDADAIETCVNSLRGKHPITVKGLDQNGRPATVTGVVLGMELGHDRFIGHQTLVKLIPT